MQEPRTRHIPQSGDAACPECAETIKLAARMCRFCGYDLIKQRHTRFESKPPSRRDARPQLVQFIRSPGIAAFLSFMWPGGGQIYSDKVARGLWIAIGAPVAWFLYFIFLWPWTSLSGMWFAIFAYLAFFVWQILDAANCANEFNRAGGARSRGRPTGGRSRRRSGSRARRGRSRRRR